MRTTKISIIILSHNRLDDLRANLPAVMSGLGTEMELVVVDNASTDGSLEFLEEFREVYPRVRLVLHNSNTGVAIGRNSGFLAAAGEYVVSLDDDAVMSVQDIKRVPALFALHQQAGILAFSVRHTQTGKKQNDHGDSATWVANFHGAGHAIRAELFERIGYLDELCSFGGEEFDFSVRCHAAGYGTIYVPEVEVLHNSFLRPGPIGAERREKWVYNYVRVLHKHFPRQIASLYSIRYTVLNIIWAWNIIDSALIQRLFRAALLGILHGRRVHAPVPIETVKFYSDPTLWPQFGNVPLNLLQRCSRKITKSSRRRS